MIRFKIKVKGTSKAKKKTKISMKKPEEENNKINILDSFRSKGINTYRESLVDK